MAFCLEFCAIDPDPEIEDDFFDQIVLLVLLVLQQIHRMILVWKVCFVATDWIGH